MPRISIGGEDRFADDAAVEQGFGRAHGVVVTHVLVDGQRDAGGLTGMDGFNSFGIVQTKRLLRGIPLAVFRRTRL